MIAPAIVTEVRRLLAEKSHSHRRIAQLTGISRGTVGAIASGKRPDYEARRPLEDQFQDPLGPPERCSGCGGMVYMPCVLCRVREASTEKSRSTQPHRAMEFPEPLGLSLRPDHHRRYEQVRAWRRENRCQPAEGAAP